MSTLAFHTNLVKPCLIKSFAYSKSKVWPQTTRGKVFAIVGSLFSAYSFRKYSPRLRFTGTLGLSITLAFVIKKLENNLSEHKTLNKAFSKPEDICMRRQDPDRYQDLANYIKTKYPTFPISNYTSIADFEKAGLPCHFAIKNNDLDLLRLLILAGSDDRRLDHRGCNIFILYEELEAQKTVQFTRDALKETLLDALLEKDDAGLCDDFYGVPLVFSFLSDPDLKDKISLLIAKVGKQETALKNWREPLTGNSLLHLAIQPSAVPEILKKPVLGSLILFGCETDVKNNRGQTPLVLALQMEQKDLLKILLEKATSEDLNNAIEFAYDAYLKKCIFNDLELQEDVQIEEMLKQSNQKKAEKYMEDFINPIKEELSKKASK